MDLTFIQRISTVFCLIKRGKTQLAQCGGGLKWRRNFFAHCAVVHGLCMAPYLVKQGDMITEIASLGFYITGILIANIGWNQARAMVWLLSD